MQIKLYYRKEKIALGIFRSACLVFSFIYIDLKSIHFSDNLEGVNMSLSEFFDCGGMHMLFRIA